VNARVLRIGEHRTYRSGTNWPAVLAYEVQEGVEMTLEEIATVAGVTKEAVRQVEASAFRKLARNVALIRIEREWRR